jgi:hypothetical protein
LRRNWNGLRVHCSSQKFVFINRLLLTAFVHTCIKLYPFDMA